MIVIPPASQLRKFNLSASQYIALWDLTGGHCPLCSKPFNSKIPARNACIDHDHRTFKVRGLVCAACNYELGVHHDNANWFDACARYLRYPSTYQIGLNVLVADEPPSLQSPSKGE